MRNIKNQLLMAENHLGEHQPPTAAAQIHHRLVGQQSGSPSVGGATGDLAGTNEGPLAALVVANLIDSLDMNGEHALANLGGATNSHAGHLGLNSYSSTSQQQAEPLAPSAINNNSLALYRLLNLINQSVQPAPQSHISLSSAKSLQAPSPMANLAADSELRGGFGAYQTGNQQQPHQQPQQHQQQQQQLTQTSNGNAWPPSRKRTAVTDIVGFKRDKQQAYVSSGNINSEKVTPSSSLESKVPHDADSEIIAANSGPRCDKFTPDICVDDFEYPEQAIIDEIQKKRDVFELMYSEVKDNEPLVDGIPRDVEESYNYDYYYYGAVKGGAKGGWPNAEANLSSAGSYPVPQFDGMDALIGAITPQAAPSSPHTQQVQSPPTTGFICPSEVMYGKPKLAKNKKGFWKVIVNAGEFTQTVRLEKCLLPNKRCNYVSAVSYESRCAQVHSYHRLLVFEKGRGFYIDTFRLPTGCNCHVTRKQTSGAGIHASAGSIRE